MFAARQQRAAVLQPVVTLRSLRAVRRNRIRIFFFAVIVIVIVMVMVNVNVVSGLTPQPPLQRRGGDRVVINYVHNNKN